MVTKRQPGINEDRHTPAAADSAGLSPRAQAQPDDRAFGGGRGDHLGTFGRDSAVLAEAGSDFRKVVQAS